ncbi:ferredoxin-NADP reductase [Rhodococcus sp. Leaf7]|uniref:NAD(P)/FAD-dependent oxidoreductase n=1 Tax=unclassified Rhodococcus (in: high G+C Gram-positive bacteria) TaxID=192944 RepID=UPI0006F3170F|nr:MULTISPECIES: NAD(P)/FAD-dependent oxidoreductase [unclassified Rhodococcus (in: high G+C Gram-positive bacteria)]KQU07877.1 ferredoxin-NADP reductase [Rhodococcus sp. Leaf7]KQU43396.1 ferredoxin-NADP reductase [Rhodococcus sp. Leaf247]
MTSQPPVVTTDVAIVGAGPTGLYGAYYAGFRGLDTVVIDALPQAGGQVMALYPEKQIRDVAALPSIRGRDFIANLVQQADAFSPTYMLGRQTVDLSHEDGAPVLTLDDGTVIRAGAVVLTAGIGTPTPRAIETGTEWLGSGLSYFVVDPTVHTGQDVVIVGGGDSALDWADALSSIAGSVTLVHRRATFRGHAATLDRVRSGKVAIHTDTEVTGLVGDVEAGVLTEVTLRAKSGHETVVAADHVIAALGFISNLGPIKEWNLELRGRSIAVDRSGRTNLPRVYAAGDVTDYDGKVKLMSVGFGEVATAMNHVAVDLDPDLVLFPGHSTDGA